MAAVYRAFDRLESSGAYLRRAVINTARSWHRDELRQQEHATLLARGVSALEPDDAELLDAIGRLAYRQRVVIVARYWGGWSEAEIGASALPSSWRPVPRRSGVLRIAEGSGRCSSGTRLWVTGSRSARR